MKLVYLKLIPIIFILGCEGRRTREENASDIEMDKIETDGQGRNRQGKNHHFDKSARLKVFLQNTPGMDGFSYESSRFKTNLYGFLNDINDQDSKKVSSFSYYQLFTGQKVVYVTSKTKDFSRKLESINLVERHAYGIRSKEVDFSQLLQIVVDTALSDSNSITMLISNMVFRTDGDATINMETYLSTQKEDIRSALQGTSNLAILLLRDTATYKLKEKDGKMHVGKQRPYYVLLIGKPNTLYNLVKDLSLESRFTHSFWMQRIKKEILLKAAVVKGHPWVEGKYERDRKEKYKIIDAEPSHDGRFFSFVAQIDAQSLGPFAKILKKAESWKVESSNGSVLKVGREKTFSPEDGFSDFIVIRQPGNFSSGDLVVSVPYVVPKWISENTFSDYTGIGYDSPSMEGKSFGLNDIVTGMAEVFSIKGQALTKGTFKISR